MRNGIKAASAGGARKALLAACAGLAALGLAWLGLAWLGLALGVQAAPAPQTTPPGTLVATYTLPPLRLQQLQPGIANDRQFLLGSIGSGLWHGRNDPANTFWLLSDRGPNVKVDVDGQERRTFPVPDFDPLIVQVRTTGNKLEVLKTIPIVDAAGKGVTGLPNTAAHDDPGYTYDGKTQLPFNPNGIDPEGLVRTRQGDFWVVEEYGPSLLHIAANGKVLKRYVPQGVSLDGATYPVAATLPGIFAARKNNRGFEGLALSPDERTLSLVLQSPLSNPDKKTGKKSRNTRILTFDIASEQVTAEYVYPIDKFGDFDPATPNQDEMKVSGLTALDGDTLIALERTDAVAKLYLIELAGATNILGSQWDAGATSPSLEATKDLAAAGITPLAKQRLINFASVPGAPRKIEGVAVLDKQTVAIANDDDFDIASYDAAGNHTGEDVASQLLIVRLGQPLP